MTKKEIRDRIRTLTEKEVALVKRHRNGEIKYKDYQTMLKDLQTRRIELRRLKKEYK